MLVRRFRARLLRMPWYRQRNVVMCRLALHSKESAFAMVIALMAALFLPDLWIICGIGSSLVLDVILTLVMLAFTIELCIMVITDPTYPCSFFFLMDIVGTVSMCFDISYMAGSRADQALVSEEGEAGSNTNLMFLRAARAAKIGARAGRLTRVVRILQFLPFLSSAGTQEESLGIAKVISSQLCNLLATRIACLTILLVMVIPLFDILNFPQVDYGLSSWVTRLSVSYRNGRPLEFDLLNEFYAGTSYGPYDACIGHTEGDDFICDVNRQELSPSWLPPFQKPSRLASATQIHDQGFMIAYNMHQPELVEALVGMANIVLILFIMVFSGLALSSMLTTLAVQPLERMLDKVRQIATTVFRFSADIIEESWDLQGEGVNIDTTSEMKLLEKVVQKLAVLAQLQTNNEENEVREDMEDEDVGVLNMMNGRNVVEEKAKTARVTAALTKKVRGCLLQEVRLEDFTGISQETYSSWRFNALTLTMQQQVSVALYTISKFEVGGLEFERPDEALLQKFITAVESEYLPNPFHNFAHAVDVLHTSTRMMRLMHTELFLSELEHFALLVAAIGHDVGHPGVNNGFLQEVGDSIALQYNDKSPLENLHCSKLYSIICTADTNVFVNLSKDEYKECRKTIVETILHTDMMGHGAMVKDLQVLFQVNYEIFARNEKAQGKTSPPEEPGDESEVFHKPATKMLAMSALLHAADVSNPCRFWEVTRMWAGKCLDEFFEQGDREKECGIPVQFLNDREKLNKPNSQIGFIEFMIAPLFAASIRLWPGLAEMGEHLAENTQEWMGLWVEETHPTYDEVDKVGLRVAKVQASMENASLRRE